MSDNKEQEPEKTDAEKKVEKLEENPPEKLEDWPTDDAKYVTFGGEEHKSGYEEAATSKLGPSSLRHHEDGSVSIEGEKVDNPEDYKGDPIPGGPTDPDGPDMVGKTREEKKKEIAEEDDGPGEGAD